MYPRIWQKVFYILFIIISHIKNNDSTVKHTYQANSSK